MALGESSKLTKMGSKKKSSNKSFREERSPEEQAMMDRVDEQDKEEQSKIDAFVKES